MNSRPARNELLQWERNDKGEAQIKVTRQETWKVRLLSKLFYVPKDRTITLDEVGCLGMCYAEPLVDVLLPGGSRVFFRNVSPDDVPSLIESYVGKSEIPSAKPFGYLGDTAVDGVEDLASLPMMQEYVPKFRSRPIFEAFTPTAPGPSSATSARSRRARSTRLPIS